MSDCLLVLYWPDFAGPDAAPTLPPYTPDLVAHELQRQLCAQFEDMHAYVWDPLEDGGPLPHSRFSRWGVRPLAQEPDAATLSALAAGLPDIRDIFLMMAPERAQALLQAAELEGRQVVVWSPGEPALGDDPGVETHRLWDALHLSTIETVGLYVDATALERDEERDPFETATLLRQLQQAAQLVGALVSTRIVGGEEAAERWERADAEPAPETVETEAAPEAGDPGEALREELQRLALDRRAPRTWVVCSDGAWLPEVIRAAHAGGRRVLLWWTEEERLSLAARIAADSVSALPLSLPGAAARVDRLPWRRSRDIQAEIRIGTQTMPRVHALGTGEGGELSETLVLPAGVASGGRLNPWIRLIYHAETTLRRQGWVMAPMRRLAGELAEVEEFGPTPANASMWLNRARAEGLLMAEPEPARTDAPSRGLVCRPDPDHPLYRTALDIPDRCLRLLYQMLQKIPWVSFKLLRNVLLREQWLGGPPYRLDEAAIDEWLNFLIHTQAIHMTKEPNLVNPDYPVTALRLNDEHPLSRTVITEAHECTRLATERAILAVDHFLTRNRKPWMAMGALRRALEGLGREELQSVLQGLQNLGALITESYPNPQKEHFTTGCRLKADEPVVARALGTRNTIIRVTQYHHRNRTWVPLSRLADELSTMEDGSASHAQRLAWFLLLRDEGILELDCEGLLPGDAWQHVRCRLNVTDAVVRAVVADREPGNSGVGIAAGESG